MTSPLTETEMKLVLEIMNQMVIKAENADWNALRLLDKKRRLIILGDHSGRPEEGNPLAKTNSSQTFSDTCGDKTDRLCIAETDITANQSTRAIADKILEIDQHLNNTLADAKKRLLTQSRKHHEQIKAKKRYNMASVLS